MVTKTKKKTTRAGAKGVMYGGPIRNEGGGYDTYITDDSGLKAPPMSGALPKNGALWVTSTDSKGYIGKQKITFKNGHVVDYKIYARKPKAKTTKKTAKPKTKATKKKVSKSKKGVK